MTDSVTPIALTAQQRVLAYATAIMAGEIECNRWVYAAIQRFQADLLRTDIYMDWDEVDALNEHFESLALVGEWSGKAFELHDWQLFIVANIQCWKWTADKLRRFKLCLVQIGRGNGKSTLMAGLLLWDLIGGVSKAHGRRCHIIANNMDQAKIILDTAMTMTLRNAQLKEVITSLWDMLEIKDNDSTMAALPAQDRSLDGLNPSMWIADEASEMKGRFLTKLTTTGAKRKESTGIIISTPGHNPENIYMEIVKMCEGILSAEIPTDDTVFAMMYGLDKDDELHDETKWVKANPGLPFGQPDVQSLRRSWKTMSQSPAGRSEFSRFHASRFDENTGGWLDLTHYEEMTDKEFDLESLKGKPCWGGLDLSKTGDMTALVLIFPLPNDQIFVLGRYWFPKEGLHQRSLDYRMPCIQWEREGFLETCPGREISYEQIRLACQEAKRDYDLRQLAFDSWGSSHLAETLIQDGLPLVKYRMAISTFGPGCALFQNLWMGKRMRFKWDPVFRRACAEAHAKTDLNGNIRPIKSRTFAIIDPLVASIMAIHAWGGKTNSIYEQEQDILR